jgi:hypothetical protein
MTGHTSGVSGSERSKSEHSHPPTIDQAAGKAPLPPYLRQLRFPRRI